MKNKNLSRLILFLGIVLMVFAPSRLKIYSQEPIIKIKKKESPKASELRIVNKGDLFLLRPMGHFSYWSTLDSADDYKDYEFITGEGTFACTLSNIPEGSDYDLYLYDCNLQTLAYSDYGGNSDEYIEYEVGIGLYYVRVICWGGGDSTQSYHLYGTIPDPTDAPELRILSITASDTNPIVGDYITITTEIVNYSYSEAPPSVTAIYKHLDSPPVAPLCWLANYQHTSGYLGPFAHFIFTDWVTSYEDTTWNVYGLVDCDDEITELNDCNNAYGPMQIFWRQPSPKPDLVFWWVSVSDEFPGVANYDYLYTTTTVYNSGDAYAGGFWTDIFYDRTYAPSPPIVGDDYRWTSSLPVGSTNSFTFVTRNSAGNDVNCNMYLLTDSQGRVDEGEDGEDNNVDGPRTIHWTAKTPYPTRTRDEIINTAMEFVEVEWMPSDENILKPSECQIWNIDPRNNTGFMLPGVAYEWGAWDRPADFTKLLDLQYNSSEYFKPGTYDSTDCVAGGGDPFWAIGCDCAGLVSRAWNLSYHCETGCLANYASYQLGDIDSLLRGDVLNDPGNHVAIFYDWYAVDTMTVIEAIHPRVIKREWASSKYNNYTPYRYNNVQETSSQICGDANSDSLITVGDVVWLINYLFKGGPAPTPLCKADVNGSKNVSISDIVYLINYLFRGGLPPVTPCC